MLLKQFKILKKVIIFYIRHSVRISAIVPVELKKNLSLFYNPRFLAALIDSVCGLDPSSKDLSFWGVTELKFFTMVQLYFKMQTAMLTFANISQKGSVTA